MMKTFEAQRGFSVFKKTYVITIVSIIIMSETLSIVCIKSVSAGFVFALFQLAGLMLPGTAILLLLGWNQGLDWRGCGFSYITGYCLDLLVYFVIMLLGIKKYSIVIISLIAISSITYICFKCRGQGNYFIDSKTRIVDNILVMVLVGALFLVCLFVGSFSSLVPPFVNKGSVTFDVAYWVGDIIELSREFPPLDFRNYLRLSYQYHYFSAAQLSLVNIVTRIRPLYLGQYFSTVQSVLLRAFAAYNLVGLCTENVRRRALGLILLFSSSGVEAVTGVYNLLLAYHIKGNGLDSGFSLFLVFLYLIINKNDNEDTNSIKTSILIWGIVFVILGTKSSYAAIAIVGLGIICIGWLFRKEYSKAFITGLPALALFLIGYFFMFDMSRYTTAWTTNAAAVGITSEASGMLTPIWRTYASNLFNLITDTIHASGLPAVIVFIPVYTMLVNPVCFVAVIYILWMSIKRGRWSCLDTSFASMYISGMFLNIFVTMFGRSQMYFAMASCTVAVIWFLRSPEIRNRTWKIVILTASVASVICFSMGKDEHGSIWDFTMGSIGMLRGYEPRFDDVAYLVHYEEYEAFEWIRQNTDESCRVAINKYSRIPGVFSERMYNDLYFTDSVFLKRSKKEIDQALDKYRKSNVEYIVYDRIYDDNIRVYDEAGWDPEYLEGSCEIVYETDNITIYRIV